MTPKEICEIYDGSIVFRRWGAAWIDLIAVTGCILIPNLILSPEIYEKTIFIWFLLAISYYPLLEGLTGRTLGRWITQTKIVDEKGNIPGVWKAIKRTLSRLIEINPFLLGGLPAGIAVLVSKTRQRVGDMWAKTYVLKTKDLQRLDSTSK